MGQRGAAHRPFAPERREGLGDERVIYRLAEPQRDGATALTLTPLEFIDHLAALIPLHPATRVLAPLAPPSPAATP